MDGHVVHLKTVASRCIKGVTLIIRMHDHVIAQFKVAAFTDHFKTVQAVAVIA